MAFKLACHQCHRCAEQPIQSCQPDIDLKVTTDVSRIGEQTLADAERLTQTDGVVKIRRETKGRKGKGVEVLETAEQLYRDLQALGITVHPRRDGGADFRGQPVLPALARACPGRSQPTAQHFAQVFLPKGLRNVVVHAHG